MAMQVSEKIPHKYVTDPIVAASNRGSVRLLAAIGRSSTDEEIAHRKRKKNIRKLADYHHAAVLLRTTEAIASSSAKVAPEPPGATPSQPATPQPAPRQEPTVRATTTVEPVLPPSSDGPSAEPNAAPTE